MKRTNTIITAALIVLAAMPGMQASQNPPAISKANVAKKSFGYAMLGGLTGLMGSVLTSYSNPTANTVRTGAAVGALVGSLAGATIGYKEEKRRINNNPIQSKTEIALKIVKNAIVYPALAAAACMGVNLALANYWIVSRDAPGLTYWSLGGAAVGLIQSFKLLAELDCTLKR